MNPIPFGERLTKEFFASLTKGNEMYYTTPDSKYPQVRSGNTYKGYYRSRAHEYQLFGELFAEKVLAPCEKFTRVRNLILTGSAGSGKSMLIGFVSQIFFSAEWSVKGGFDSKTETYTYERHKEGILSDFQIAVQDD